MIKKKAIFFDRDGVLNKSLKVKGKPLAPLRYKDFKLYKNIEKYLEMLKKKDFLLVVVTNQPDFYKKNKKELILINKKLYLIGIDKIFCCYAKSDLSPNKKPNIGLVKDFIKIKKIKVNKSFVIGDRWRDIDFSYNLKCRSIFIDRRYREKLKKKPNYTCYSTSEAIKKILSFNE